MAWVTLAWWSGWTSTARALTIAGVKPRDETEADLLRQIMAAPGDDAPRRVLADLLQGRGDPRGEYIAVECDLAAHRFGPESGQGSGHTWDELSKRSSALFNQHYAEWERPHKERGALTVWRRGFPQILLLAPAAFVEHGAALLEWNPIDHVHFFGPFQGTDVGAAVAASPVLARLDQVDLGDSKLDDDAAVAFSGTRAPPRSRAWRASARSPS